MSEDLTIIDFKWSPGGVLYCLDEQHRIWVYDHKDPPGVGFGWYQIQGPTVDDLDDEAEEPSK